MPNIKASDPKLSEEELIRRVAKYGPKIAWFMSHGYKPHYYQLMFHTMETDNVLTRFRHLVAGRRGGKTLSAIWEVMYYCQNPSAYWYDFHGITGKDDPLWVWVLAKDYKIGTAARLGFRNALKESKLVYGDDYREHKTERFVEFKNDTLVEFKTADDPESLRGAGLNLLWVDESAFIPDNRAWNVVSPALADKQGGVITTTTPDGKNWFYDEWFSGESLSDDNVGRIEYTSLDNPFFPKKEWEYQKRRSHPLQFKREYMASFDAMSGKDLAGDWLHFYDKKDLEGKELYTYMGVDPAISLADDADQFSMTLIGLEKGSNDVFLLEQYNGRIPFPEQVQKIQEWHIKYRPQLIGVENTAYQAALAQQTARLSTIPPINPIQSKGKKSERILSMAPLFQIGKVRIRKDHEVFINQWVDYNSELKNPKDDALDSCEIALRTAGALLPEIYVYEESEPISFEDKVRARVPGRVKGFDNEMGIDW